MKVYRKISSSSITNAYTVTGFSGPILNLDHHYSHSQVVFTVGTTLGTFYSSSFSNTNIDFSAFFTKLFKAKVVPNTGYVLVAVSGPFVLRSPSSFTSTSQTSFSPINLYSYGSEVTAMTVVTKTSFGVVSLSNNEIVTFNFIAGSLTTRATLPSPILDSKYVSFQPNLRRVAFLTKNKIYLRRYSDAAGVQEIPES